MTARRGASVVATGDAQILCRYLDVDGDGGIKLWLQWSQQHPAAARVLWPSVARVARQELYVFVPDLFALARQRL